MTSVKNKRPLVCSLQETEPHLYRYAEDNVLKTTKDILRKIIPLKVKLALHPLMFPPLEGRFSWERKFANQQINKISEMLRSSRFDTAMSIAEAALQKYPKNRGLLILKARTLDQMKRFEAAEEVWQRVLARAPNNLEAKKAILRADFRNNDQKRARQRLAGVVNLMADPIEAQLFEATCLAEYGTLEEADEAYRKCVVDFPDSEKLICAYGLHLEKRGDPLGALQTYELFLANNTRAIEIKRQWSELSRSLESADDDEDPCFAQVVDAFVEQVPDVSALPHQRGVAIVAPHMTAQSAGPLIHFLSRLRACYGKDIFLLLNDRAATINERLRAFLRRSRIKVTYLPDYPHTRALGTHNPLIDMQSALAVYPEPCVIMAQRTAMKLIDLNLEQVLIWQLANFAESFLATLAARTPTVLSFCPSGVPKSNARYVRDTLSEAVAKKRVSFVVEGSARAREFSKWIDVLPDEVEEIPIAHLEPRVISAAESKEITAVSEICQAHSIDTLIFGIDCDVKGNERLEWVVRELGKNTSGFALAIYNKKSGLSKIVIVDANVKSLGLRVPAAAIIAQSRFVLTSLAPAELENTLGIKSVAIPIVQFSDDSRRENDPLPTQITPIEAVQTIYRLVREQATYDAYRREQQAEGMRLHQLDRVANALLEKVNDSVPSHATSGAA